MKNQRGFIATSLIYSFFLVFVALIAAILNSYLANKTILERFNEEVQNSLNNKSYTLQIQTKNAVTPNSMTLTNLISNSNFIDSTNWTSNNCDYTFNVPYLNYNSSASKINCRSTEGYLKQSIPVEANNIYYYSVTYINNSNSSSALTRSYLGSTDYGYLEHSYSTSWTKKSGMYISGMNQNTDFIVGYNPRVTYAESMYTNVMVINLSSGFGMGNEPDVSWVDENIDWFDGTINYYRKENILKNSSIKIKFIIDEGHTNSPSISCKNDHDEDVTDKVNYDEPRKGDEEYGQVFVSNVEINGMDSNIKCNIEWR